MLTAASVRLLDHAGDEQGGAVYAGAAFGMWFVGGVALASHRYLAAVATVVVMTGASLVGIWTSTSSTDVLANAFFLSVIPCCLLMAGGLLRGLFDVVRARAGRPRPDAWCDPPRPITAFALVIVMFGLHGLGLALSD